MLLKAKKTIKTESVHFVQQNAKTLALKNESFYAIIMLYDSINYMFNENEIIQTFNEISRVLTKKGVFIFDIVTQEGLKDCYEDYYESNNWDGLAYERHSWYSFKDRVQHNDFIFLYNGKSYKEAHLQKIRTIKDWRKLIAKSNMKLSHEFSNFSKLSATEKSERVHFVCHSISD